MPLTSDEDLVERMAGGDTGAVRELYDRHGAALYAYVVGRLREPELAEEVLQDVMLAAWNAAAQYRREGRVISWLLAIAHRRAINAAVARSRRPEAPWNPDLDRVTPSTGHRRAEVRADVASLIAGLPDEQSATLELVFGQGLTSAEIADVTGVTASTVRSRLRRALATLRESLSDEGGGAGAARDDEGGKGEV